MTIDIVTPTFPESIQEGTIAKWHKRPGEPVARDEVLVDVETDKVVVEVVAPADGSLAEILLPEQAIVCDESVSSGRDFFPKSWHAAPHDYLQVTGGAIGCGLPLATGAAIGAPGRKVITLQADGSAMYTVQALWTQARERLDVVTVIFSNRSYAILHGELRQVGAGAPGVNARRMLDIDDPALDWVRLAQGMGVEAARAETSERFNELLAAALKTRGPFLIEAVI